MVLGSLFLGWHGEVSPWIRWSDLKGQGQRRQPCQLSQLDGWCWLGKSASPAFFLLKLLVHPLYPHSPIPPPDCPSLQCQLLSQHQVVTSGAALSPGRWSLGPLVSLHVELKIDKHCLVPPGWVIKRTLSSSLALILGLGCSVPPQPLCLRASLGLSHVVHPVLTHLISPMGRTLCPVQRDHEHGEHGHQSHG